MYNAVSERGGFFSGQGFAASETLTAWQEAWDHRSEKKQRPGQEQQQQHQQQEDQQHNFKGSRERATTATATATATAKAATATTTATEAGTTIVSIMNETILAQEAVGV